MVSVVEINEKDISKEQLGALYDLMLKNRDEHNASKIMELYEKYIKNEYIICFSGHFSAGKSSIINELIGKDVLPKSPIPTSANIVKITSGEGVAKVYFKEDDPVQYKEPYDIDTIKDYCMDRDTIKQLEISTSEEILPVNTAIIDSPGIDAADDADRLMTESAIHLIDTLCYVMDYNHVQSEVNLHFLQEMQKLSIPIWIIINQVDKHQESEISFADYTKRVKQTFDQWGIYPNALYFTTILKPKHPLNQLDALKKDVFDQLSQTYQIDVKLMQSVKAVMDAHQTFLKNTYERQLEATHDDNLSQDTHEKIAQLEHQLATIHQQRAAFETAYQEEVQLTLKNAYLMPRKMRDLAESFLLSEEKDFKIGLFQSKKKTTAEREHRLRVLSESLSETIETTIEWKLREKIIALLQQYNVAEENLLEKVQQLHVRFDEDQLRKHLKPGAQVNGNYVLHYTNDVSAGIKTAFRSEMSQLWQTIQSHADTVFQKEIDQLSKQLAPYKLEQEHIAHDENVQDELAKKQTEVKKQWENPLNDPLLIEQLERDMASSNQIREESLPEQTEKETEVQEESIIEAGSPAISMYDIDGMTVAIDKVMEEIVEMNGFQTIVDDLSKKKDRLENRKLTIALFGTFSAGKSSFSNALFGEKVLPVSPNPTTAVISRISPVTSQNTHGTVHITLKSQDELISDLAVITKHITKKEMSLDQWIAWMKKENIDQHDALSKTFQAYLHAVIAGYSTQKDYLGNKITIGLEEFAAYVTDEEIACFIKEVDLYYDCALTRKGITLVDTPGADSVNARHTNVAFDYIKEADAILYVTYYNHAITSGDRDFLIQLGRVKEAFEMDKMFFIVNASDLAENETDLRLVVHYVSDQLLQFGIRNPKIYPVSSKASLEEKQENRPLNNEMKHFEDVFYQFIDHDLIALTVESAIWDMTRAKNMLKEFIQSLELDGKQKEQKIKQLESDYSEANKVLDQADFSVFESRFTDRIDRQLHFVLERLYINFHDMFTTFFNPGTINENGQKAMAQLEQSRNKFVDYVGYELLQEVRAVSLRIETYMRDLLKEAFQMTQEETKKINHSFIFPSQTDIDFTTPVYEQAFDNLDAALFHKALKIYKNMKSFFEQNEREKMKEAFYDILKKESDNYLLSTGKVMKETYKTAWEHHVQSITKAIQKEIQVITEEHIHMLQTTESTFDLQKAFDNLEQTIHHIES